MGGDKSMGPLPAVGAAPGPTPRVAQRGRQPAARRALAALGTVLAFAAVLVAVPLATADEAEAHPRTKTVQRCSYDPFAGQQCWTETVSVSHVHRCGAGLTGTYPNCYPIPPVTQPVCPAGMTGTPPNCYPPPPATTQPPPPPTTQPPECPVGQTGTPPNCQIPPPPECPVGQTGTPPNCKPPPDDNDGEGSATGTVSEDPCGDWASATRDALHTYGSDGVPNITPPPAGCGTTALQLARFLNKLTTSDPLDHVVLSAAESEAMRNALDALGSEYNKYITTWDSLTAAEKVLVASTACLAGAVVVPPAAHVLSPGCGVAVGLADAWLPRPTVAPEDDEQPPPSTEAPGADSDSGEQDPSDQKNLNNAKDQNGGDSDKFSDAAYNEAVEEFTKTGDLDALTDFLNEWVCHHGTGTPTTGTCE